MREAKKESTKEGRLNRSRRPADRQETRGRKELKKRRSGRTYRQAGRRIERNDRKKGGKEAEGWLWGNRRKTGRIREENKQEEARERKTGRMKLRKNAPRRCSGQEAGGRGSPDRPCCSAPLERDGLPLRPRRLGLAAP